MGANSAGGNSSVGSSTGGITGVGGVASAAGAGGLGSGGTGLGGAAGAGIGGQAIAGTTGAGTAGTTGVPLCASSPDCAALNPEVYSCSATCQAGRCVVGVDVTKIASKMVDSNTLVTGEWDASNHPYVITAPWKQTDQNATILLQQLRADGSNNGVSSTYALPDDVAQPKFLTAVRRGDALGVLWATTAISTPLLLTQIAEMTFGAIGAGPATIMSTTAATNLPETVYQVGLGAVGSTDWIMAQFSGNAPAWRGFVGSLTAPPTTLPRLTGTAYDDDSVFAIVGGTVMLTGRSCTTFRTSGCAPQLVVVRYSPTDLSLIGDSIQVSTYAYDSAVTGAKKFSPALGAVAGKLAMFWNENASDGGLLLGHTMITEQGGYAQLPVTAPSNLVPKAIAGAASGGGILFAERISSTNGNTEFVAQKFDASLALVGQAYVLSNLNTAAPGNTEVRLSSDGRVLVTYQHGGPRFSLMHVELCQ